MGMGKRIVLERELRYFFNEWELGICILLSLFLQIFLILAAPLRKIVSHKGLRILLWSAYLLADGIAIFAVGLIASQQAYYSNHCENAPTNSILHTFWAPFLLAHLGGPDTITAFALEDNELWLRHLFSLFTQCIAVSYVFYQSLTHNKLLVPSLLMFLCGIIKYAERTYALYCASAKTFRGLVLTEIRSLPLDIPENNAANLEPLEVVQYAFLCFTNFKGLVVDLIYSFSDRRHTRQFFLAISWNDAFKIVEVELNFLYDVLFTKLPVVYYKVGFGCRAVSFGSIVASLVLFLSVDKKHFKTEGFEVEITYILLTGGIVLEVIAFFMLVFSDWTVVKLNRWPRKNPNEQSWKRMFMDFIVNANARREKMICWLLNIGAVRGSGNDSLSEPTDSRWAESISGYNLIYYCSHRRSRAREIIYDKIGIRDSLDEIIYETRNPLPFYMKKFLFIELKIKSEMANNMETNKEICSAKGEFAIKHAGGSSFHLLPFVKDFEYDESLLLWHIATELCYNDKEDKEIEGEQLNRRIAKLISEYMIYLLVMKPRMMSAVSRKVLVRFRETCERVTDIFDRELSTKERLLPEVELQGIACQKFINYIKVSNKHREHPILRFAVLLSEDLKKMQVNQRWKTMSKVWVELLSYAASHVKSDAHAQQLSKGGEFITIVWLLMSQLGLVDHFEGPPY